MYEIVSYMLEVICVSYIDNICVYIYVDIYLYLHSGRKHETSQTENRAHITHTGPDTRSRHPSFNKARGQVSPRTSQLRAS